MVKVNGELQDVSGKTVREYLLAKSYDTTRIAVELNESIVFKSQYESVALKDDDVVEIVSFVGGG